MASALRAAYDAFSAGRLEEAERLCAEAARADPGSLDARGLHAVVLAQLRRFAEAEPILLELAARDPGNVEHPVNLGCVYLDQDDLPRAIEWFRRARTLAPLDTGVNYNLGIALYRAGDLAAAAPLLELVAKAADGPRDAAVYLARARLELGERHAAREVLRRLGDDGAELSAAALNEVGLAWAGLDDYARAGEALHAALLRDPALHAARINLAYLAEKQNRVEEARSLLDSVLEPARADPHHGLVHARLEARAGRLDAAVAALEAALARPAVPPALRSELLFERGRLLDRLERHEQAFGAFVEANALARDQFRRHRPAAGDPDGPIPWLDAGLDTEAPFTPPPDAGDAEAPAFLVGFPRSGTTLLDQILDAHPGLQVLNEYPALDEVVQHLRGRPGGFPAALDTMQADDRPALRSVYRAAVEAELARRPGTRLVDKYPFHLVRLPLIRRLWPGARVVLALRHPCDAVLSCFMQNFRFTEATHGFWTLEGSARIYDQIMRAWERQRAKYAPECLELRYEALVEDFRGQVERLLSFLGVPWDDRVLDYASHARGRGAIRTPSYDQVVRPIYRQAVGRWKHYRRHFEACLPLLEPHVRRLGYQL